MSMNVPALKLTSVTAMLNVPTPKDSMYAAALVDIREMAERVQVSRDSFHTLHLQLLKPVLIIS